MIVIPRRRQWLEKPPGPVSLSGHNDLAKKLSLASVVWKNQLVDLATDESPIIGSANVVANDSYGQHFTVTTLNESISFSDANNREGDDFSVVSVTSFNTVGSTRELCGKWTTGGDAWILRLSNTTLQFYCRLGGWIAAQTAGVVANTVCVFAGRYDGSNITSFVNESKNSVSGSGLAASDARVSIGVANNGSYASNARHYATYIFSPALTDDEHIEIARAPFQVLIGNNRKIFIPSGAGGVDLAGAARAQSAVTVGLSANIPVASASLTAASAQAAIAAQLPLSGIVATLSASNGQISANIAFSTAALVRALASAGLDLNAQLQADASATSDGAGTLSADAGNAALSGAGTAIADAAGWVTINATLSGAAVATALADADLISGQTVAGRANANASASGILIASVPTAGQAKAYATGHGGLSAIATVASAAASASNVSGGLDIAVSFGASALATALFNAGLTADQFAALGASGQAASTMDATLNLQVPLSVDALADATAAGALAEGFQNIPVIDRWTGILPARRLAVNLPARRYSACA